MKNLRNRQDAVTKVPDQVRSPAGDDFSALVVRILRLHGLLTAAGDTLAKPAGQTSARWWVLASVEEAPATVAQVARALRLARQSVQRVADILEQDGLLEHVQNPRHRRAKLLRLTNRGRATLSAIQAAQRVWADVIGREIGGEDLAQTSRVLDRVAMAVSSQRPQGDEA